MAEAPTPPATPSARQRGVASGSPSHAAPSRAPDSSPREHGGAGSGAASGGMLSYIPGASVVVNAVSAVSSVFGRILSPLNTVVGGRSSIPPDALSAARQFNTMLQSYGDGVPTFVESSYKDALAAANAECRFALVYLHSDLNQDTDAFCRDTLRHAPLVDYMSQTFVCWGGDVGERHGLEASVSFAAPSFPFIGVYIPASSNKYRRVWTHEGMISGEALLAKLRAAVDAASPVLEGLRAERVSREADRRLREEQDQRYQEALAADRERERQREAAAEAKELEAAKALSKQLNMEAELERIRGRLPAEPSVGATEETTRLRLTLPNGTKIQRRFFAADTLQTLFDFVTLSLHDLGVEVPAFELGSSYPRRTFGKADDLGMDLKAAGLHPQAVLFVTAKDE